MLKTQGKQVVTMCVLCHCLYHCPPWTWRSSGVGSGNPGASPLPKFLGFATKTAILGAVVEQVWKLGAKKIYDPEFIYDPKKCMFLCMTRRCFYSQNNKLLLFHIIIDLG
jgi:hypothetical protein